MESNGDDGLRTSMRGDLRRMWSGRKLLIPNGLGGENLLVKVSWEKDNGWPFTGIDDIDYPMEPNDDIRWP